MYSTLLWDHYSDTANREKWALLLVYRTGNVWGIPYSFPVQRFDHSPVNAEIYDFLRKHTHTVVESGELIPKFFRPYIERRPEFTGNYELGLRENTWKAVVGEAPTIFFRMIPDPREGN
jgi:hypothetical protein